MTTTEEFYLEMGKAIKARDHAAGRVAYWEAKRRDAEGDIESLVAAQKATQETVQVPEE